MDYLAFAVSTLPALQTVQSEAIYRCTYCSEVVRSEQGAQHFPFCSDACAVQADAENQQDGVA